MDGIQWMRGAGGGRGEVMRVADGEAAAGEGWQQWRAGGGEVTESRSEVAAG